MKAQRKTTRPKISRKDRELEELLRRAALYLKSQPVELRVARKKRVAAA